MTWCGKHFVEYNSICTFCMDDKYPKNGKEHKSVKDTVNKPAHYNKGGIECIDAIAEATKNLQGIEAVCVANVLKYIWRWKDKSGTEDLLKAKWYLERLINGTNP